MLFFLIALLSFTAIIIYMATNKEIMTPSIWLISGYILGSIVASINIKYWGEDIFITTLLVIMSGVISFAFGEAIGRSTVIGKYNTTIVVSDINNRKKDIHIPKFHVFIMSIFMVMILYLYFQYTYSLSLAGGNPGGYINMFTYSRKATFGQISDIKMGPLLQYGLLVSKAYAYICLYEIINEYFINKSIKKHLFIPFVLYFGHTILSGGRTQMMYLFIYIFVVIAVHKKYSSNWSNKGDKEIIKRGIITLAIIFFVFRIVGENLRGSIYGTERTLWGNISKYVGSSIIAFNKYLEIPSKASFFGEETLYSFYSALNKFGFNYTILPNNLEFVTWNNVSTNIYTSLRRYIHDYGYLGMAIIQVFKGILYGHFFYRIKHQRLMGLPLVLYAMLIYPVVFDFIEERFIINVLSASNIITVILIVVIWDFYAIKKKAHLQL